MAECNTNLEEGARDIVHPLLGFFTFDHAKVSVSAEVNIHTTLRECLTRAIAAFDITNPNELLCARASLYQVLASIFDADTLPLVSDDAAPTQSQPAGEKKARVLAQGIAGIIAIASQLKGQEMNAYLLDTHTKAFASSERRTDMIARIAGCDTFGDCTLRVHLEDLIVETALGITPEPAPFNDFLPLTETPAATASTFCGVDEDPFYDSEEEEEDAVVGSTTPDYPREHIALNTNEWEHSRPAATMGLPWGFTIMALN